MESLNAFLQTPLGAIAILLLVIWSLAWKGIALWRAAGNKHLVWYICMLIFNTAGILEIIYIFGFSKPKK